MEEPEKPRSDKRQAPLFSRVQVVVLVVLVALAVVLMIPNLRGSYSWGVFSRYCASAPPGDKTCHPTRMGISWFRP